jgi:hypothetical protein
MRGLAAIERRIAKLEASTPTSVVSFTMLNGSIRKMKASLVVKLCTEAVYGSKSDDVMTLLNSVSSSCSHRLVNLLKMTAGEE